MARILETLRQAGSDRSQPEETVVTARAFEPDAENMEPAPFIEVGGSRSELNASPDVAAASPSSMPRPTAAPKARLYLAPESAATDSGVIQVSFRPLPAKTLALEPACERFSRDLIAFHQPDHPVSEQHRILLAGIEAQLPPGQPHVLFLTALRPTVGATTVLLNLALTMALRGRVRVVVVDANLPRPAVAERLGLPLAAGLRDVLAGGIAPQRALRETGQEGLCALPLGLASSTNLEALAGDVMRSLLRYLRGRFDWVFIDGPAWTESRDLATFATWSDAVYLALPDKAADAVAAAEVQNLIQRATGRLRGSILTQR